MLLKDTLKDAKGISSPRAFSSLFTLCQPLREVASVVGTSIKRLWLQNAKQQDAAGDPISVLNALQGKKLRSLSTMAGKSGKCSQGANKLERGLYWTVVPLATSSQVVLDSPWDFVYFCWFHASNIWKVWISLNEWRWQSLISMSMCWIILKACWAHARLIRWNLTVGRYSKQWYIWDHFHNSFQNSSHFRNAMKTEIVIR